MICPNCKRSINEGLNFCKHCGKPIPFSQNINYHPEALFPDNEPRPPSPAYPDPDAFDALREQLAQIVREQKNQFIYYKKHANKGRLAWAIISLAILLGLAVGTAIGFLHFDGRLDKACAQINRLDASLIGVADASADMQSCMKDLPEIKELLERMSLDQHSVIENDSTVEPEAQTIPTPECWITFDANFPEGDGDSTHDKVQVLHGKALSLAKIAPPVCETATCIGWNTSPDGTGEEYSVNDWLGYDVFNITLYAQWESIDEPASDASDIDLAFDEESRTDNR